jgi:putative ABC transport system permease protein
VIFQFVISIGLIVSTVISYSQLRYIQNKKLGFDKEQVVVIYYAWFLQSHYESFKNELLAHPHIRTVTSGGPPVTGDYAWYSLKEKDGSPLTYFLYEVDYDYLKTLGIKVIAGREFSKDYVTDSTAVVVNEAYARWVGWNVQTFALETRKVRVQQQERSVVGVAADFNNRSLHEAIQPVVISLKPGVRSGVLVRIGPEDVQETLAFLKQKWEAFVPDRPFEYSFLDEDIDRVYRKEQRLGRIFGTFALLTVFVACLGLFGLAAFTAEQRTKEIGIRKVLGASVSNIVTLLSKEFILLVGLANLIAWPIAYYAMNKWLRDFAYRIDLGAGVFVLGGALALVIALLTVSVQAVKAAMSNPVEALRYE